MKKYTDFLRHFVPILLVVLLTMLLSQQFYKGLLHSEKQRCWEELSTAHNEVSREIGARLKMNIAMLNMASDAIVLRADLENEATVLSYLDTVKQQTIFDRIDVIFPNGTILVQDGTRVEDNGVKSYEELVAMGSHLSQRVTDFYTGKETIHAFSPIYNQEGEAVAILGASVHCSTLAELFKSAHFGETAHLFLVDLRDGNFVMDKWHPELGNVQDLAPLELTEEFETVDYASDIMAGNAGHLAFFSDFNHQVSYMTYSSVENTDFTLELVVQDDVVFGALNKLRRTLTLVGILEILFLLIFAAWLYYFQHHSMRNNNRAQQAELALLQQKEELLQNKYKAADSRREFLELMADNLPGGYHRCTTDHKFQLTFISQSFTQITGYNMQQLKDELDCSYMGLVAPSDREYFMSLAPQLERDGFVHCAYRMRRRDGSIRWVQDSTQRVESDGEQYYQCSLSDIHDIILKQEALARQAYLLDTLEANMPGGYHRCADAEGLPFLYISASFAEVTGWSPEEIETKFDNRFINLVLPEDVPLFAGIIEEMKQKGYSNAMYRLKKKGGGYVWVSDSTMRVTLENESFFHGVLADVTSQVEELERAKCAAEASNQAKSTFLFNISHDIRTPMNAIKGFSHIIAQNADDPVLVKETIGKILKAGDSLMMLMNDVLDISRIERGKDDLNLRPVFLYEHSRNLFEMFASDMKKAGIHFVTGGEELHDHVYCDDLKLTRIIMNMLSNAKKFTPAGGTVTFGGTCLHRDESTCTYRFFVRDTGIGMSPEFQKRAFEQFERERTSTESGVTGSGLGLAIIKMLVELMGGTVEMQSVLGEGTEIAATLTFQLASPVQEAGAVAVQRSVPVMKGKRVLLVEDNQFNREIARYILEDMQLVVEEAENGAVCIQKLLDAEPGWYDLILMDIQMPVMDGYTATIEIRNLTDKVLAATPIVAMTANAFEEDKQKCLDTGMNGHVGKPIEVEVLRQMLFDIFENR